MNSIENLIFLFCFGYKLNQFFFYANTMSNGRLVFTKKRVAEEVPEKEDGQKKYQNRNKSKLACVSLCGGGRYWITLTRRTKTVMEMCLLL